LWTICGVKGKCYEKGEGLPTAHNFFVQTGFDRLDPLRERGKH